MSHIGSAGKVVKFAPLLIPQVRLAAKQDGSDQPTIRLAPISQSRYKAAAGVECVAGCGAMHRQLVFGVVSLGALWGFGKTSVGGENGTAASQIARVRQCPCPVYSPANSAALCTPPGTPPAQAGVKTSTPPDDGPVKLLRLTREIPQPGSKPGTSNGTSRVPVHTGGYTKSPAGNEPFGLLRLTREIPDPASNTASASSTSCVPVCPDVNSRVARGNGQVRLLRSTREIPSRVKTAD